MDVFTNSLATWQIERYSSVYNRNLKIYRGVDNRVDLQVKNSDQKTQNISTRPHLVFNLINKETGELIIKKDCVIDNAATGKAFANITENELIDIESGFYHFTLHIETRTIEEDYYTVSSKSPLYINSQYGTYGIVEVGHHLSGEPIDSLRIDEFTEVIVQATAQAVTDKFFISSIIDGRPNLSVPTSTHTFQFYLTAYHGTIEIQGSQDEGADPQVWAAIDVLVSLADRSTLYKNVVGKYSWFRIKSTPNLLETNPGTLDSILYR